MNHDPARGRARVALSGVFSLLLLTAATPSSQPVPVWEDLGLFAFPPATNAIGILFHEHNSSPGAYDVFMVASYGLFLFSPQAPTEDWGNWQLRCYISCSPTAGLITADGTLIVSMLGRVSRSTDWGITWTKSVWTNASFDAIHQSTLPSSAGNLYGALNGNLGVSNQDGIPGSWSVSGASGGWENVIGEIPPSASLPDGRLLVGGFHGITYSNDGAVSFQASSAYGTGYWADSFTFVPDPSHSFGGVAYSGVKNLNLSSAGANLGTLLRSDDGGATWVEQYYFSDASMYDMPSVDAVQVLAVPNATGGHDLWAGLDEVVSGNVAGRGAILRSTDGGLSWERADSSFGGFAVNQLALAPDGVLYAATELGVWRTTAPVYSVTSAQDPDPSASPSLALRPNPSSGSVIVELAVPNSGEATLSVLDIQGRVVKQVYNGAVRAGTTTFSVDTSTIAAGVYVVRCELSTDAGVQTASERLVVGR